MLKVRDIMSKNVVTVPPTLSLRDAMDLLTSRHISGVPVTTNRKVVGVISLTDFAEFAAATPGVPLSGAQPDDALLDEASADWDNAADVDEGELAPAFYSALWDDAGADVLERMHQARSTEWNVLEEHTVAEAMSRKLTALPPEAPVDHAADVMRRAGIHRVLIMDGGDLVGVVTTRDIANAVADHRVKSREYVFGERANDRGN